MAKCTGGFSREPGFHSQHSHGHSEQSVTPAPVGPMLPLGLHRHCTHGMHIFKHSKGIKQKFQNKSRSFIFIFIYNIYLLI